MTRELSSPIEAFVGRLRQMHPELAITCDVPDTPSGSTWIDIRVGVDWIVIEYRPDLGFGFSDPRNGENALYGTPSSRFVRTMDEAFEQLDRTLLNLSTPVRDA